MRSHHAKTRPPPDLPHGPFRPLTPGERAFILEEAAFKTSPCTADYTTCQLCGAPIGWGELIASTDPRAEVASFICWRCLVGILLYRGLVSRVGDTVPALIGAGEILLQMATPRADRPADRASTARQGGPKRPKCLQSYPPGHPRGGV